MQVYLAERQKIQTESEKERFIRRCLADFSPIDRKQLDKAEFRRETGGRPYLLGSKIEFSLSHSGSYIGCAVSRFRLGFDLQEIRPANFRGIAERFFSREEQLYMEKFGESAFFSLWSRKEAFVKCTGRGMAQGFSSFSTVKDGRLSAVILSNSGPADAYRIRELEIAPDFCAAVCIPDFGNEAEEEIREVRIVHEGQGSGTEEK